LRVGGAEAYAAPFDVTDHEQVGEAVKRIEADVGPIDILINNAGIQRRGPLEDCPEETWRELMRANLDSVFFVSQAVARAMIPRGRGRIINVGSVQCEVARPNIAPYTASKGGVKMLTKGLVEDEKFSAWLTSRTPIGRWGDVDELVGAAIFLASDASSFVNGHILYVDGGVTA